MEIESKSTVQGECSKEESEQEHYFLKLRACEVPLYLILLELSLVDQVKFASTNREILKAAKESSKCLRSVDDLSCFNLDIFPEIPITKTEIDTVHRTFENLQKLKVDLTFVENTFLNDIRKFKNLNKLSVYMGPQTRNNGIHPIYLKSITIKSKFTTSDHDVIYSFLTQIMGLKTLSLYNGMISLKTTTLLEARKLTKLKIHNTNIKSCYYFIKFIQDCKTLEHLSLTSNNYIAFPHPVFVASDIISQMNIFKLGLTHFSFTVDTGCKIKYENLKYLKKLKQLKNFYTVQGQTINIERLIDIAATFKTVDVAFIEYFDKTRIFNRTMFDATERKSYCIQTIINSKLKYMQVFTVNYDELRLDPELTYLE